MGRTSIASSPTAPLTLHECATIAEEVQHELDRAAAVLDELLSHQEFPDATTELVAQNVLCLARKLERGDRRAVRARQEGRVMAPRYTWTDGQVLAAIEATIYAKNGQHELAELWTLGRVRLAEGPGKHNVNRVMLKALAIRICKDVIERAARSGQPWKGATPPFLSKAQARDASEHLRVIQKSLGRHSPVMMRARSAQRICCNRRQAPRPSTAADAEAWLRRRLEGLGQ